MTTYPKWSDVKSQLDDPNISAADKNRLLKAYADEAAYGSPNFLAGNAETNPDYVANQAEIADYATKYNATDEFQTVAEANSGMLGTQLDSSLQAKGAAEYILQSQRDKNTQQAAQAKTQLGDESKKTVAQGGSGASTSDEILEPGSRGMYYFQYFIPPYKNWTGNAPDLDKDIRNVYDNLRGIQFAKFRADATQLSTSHGKLSDITLNLSTDTNSLGGFWQGPAAQAAQQYCGTFVQNGQTVTDGTSAASQVIGDSMKAIETAVLQRAQAVLGMYADEIGGFSPDDIQQIIDAAQMKANDDELKSMSNWNVFSNVDWGDTNCGGGLSQNVKNLASMDATNWLNTQFVPNFNQKKTSFDSITTSTHNTVGQSFDSMNQGLGKITADPFSDLSKGIQVPSSGSGSGGSGSGGSGSGGSGSGGGAGSGGSGSGGGGATAPSSVGGGGGGVRRVAAARALVRAVVVRPRCRRSRRRRIRPAHPARRRPRRRPSRRCRPCRAVATRPPATRPPATRPPATRPPDPPGAPGVPVTPGTPGTPVSMTPTGGTQPPETMTVQHGDSTLSMTSPDSQGTVQLTTQDANGQSHKYDIDFGNGTGTGTGSGMQPACSPVSRSLGSRSLGPPCPPVRCRKPVRQALARTRRRCRRQVRTEHSTSRRAPTGRP